MEIERDTLIEIIQECCAYIVWDRERCFLYIGSDDEKKFEEIIDKFN